MVSAVIGEKPYKTELFASGHQLIADEPVEIGGGDEGPPPGQFLELSLASCTAITLRMYAIRKSLSLKNIRVEVQSERTSDNTIFRMEIYLEGEITDEQRTRLLQIAKACPVHKTLTKPIAIETTLK